MWWRDGCVMTLLYYLLFFLNAETGDQTTSPSPHLRLYLSGFHYNFNFYFLTLLPLCIHTPYLPMFLLHLCLYTCVHISASLIQSSTVVCLGWPVRYRSSVLADEFYLHFYSSGSSWPSSLLSPDCSLSWNPPLVAFFLPMFGSHQQVRVHPPYPGPWNILNLNQSIKIHLHL